MPLILLQLRDGFATLLDAAGTPSNRIQLTPEFISEINELSAQYQALLKKKDIDAELLAIGQQLFRLVDGDAHGLQAILDDLTGDFTFEIRSKAKPSAEEQAVLAAPWELLADAQGFLAQDAQCLYCPVRRLGISEQQTPTDAHRLGIMFMAASPRGQQELDFEAEETAIIRAVPGQDIDLVVEESGDPEQLGIQVANVPMPILHLSCHGAANYPHNKLTQPVLMLEDAYGDDRPTTSSDIKAMLGANIPSLLFLSACQTATAPASATAAQSMALALVRCGLPAVLGWDGKVYDDVAIGFASKLYERLALKISPAQAAAEARQAMLQDENPRRRGDWHLARLWLGKHGGAPIVAGNKPRSLLPLTHGAKGRLGNKDIPVAAHEMFVGRRRYLQDCLKNLQANDHAGVLLHGLGRLGKSSLAARLANRMKGSHKLAVVYKNYDAASVLLELREALGACPEALRRIDTHLPTVAQTPAYLEEALRALFCTEDAPCRTDTPVLLVIDDLEQILEAPEVPEQAHRLKHPYAPVLKALLTVFDPTLTKSRLLLTSRYSFQLDRLEQRLLPIQLRTFSESEQNKLLLRYLDAVPQAFVEERENLIQRGLNVSSGIPGLQDLILGKLVLNPTVPLPEAEQAIAQMEAWLAGKDLPEQEQLREMLEKLALEHLFTLAGDNGRNLLRAATVFQLPVPAAIIDAMAKQMEASLIHLRGLGLLEPYEDVVDPHTVALALNTLVRKCLEPLPEAQTRAALGSTLPLLFEAWGGNDRGSAPTHTDIELTRLALITQNAAIAAICGQYGVRGLSSIVGNPIAASLGIEVVGLCRSQQVVPPIMLLVNTANAANTSGEVSVAEDLLQEAKALLETAKSTGQLDVSEEEAVLHSLGTLLKQHGQWEQAQQCFHTQYHLAQNAGHLREAAIAKGQLAEILCKKGQPDEAICILTEEVLPVYTKLGDSRSIAVTHSGIADILIQKGQLSKAMSTLRDDVLPVFKRLGDTCSIAIIHGKIAEILFQMGQLSEAMNSLRDDVLPALTRLGDTRSIAITHGTIVKILSQKGQFEAAMGTLRDDVLPAFKKIGDVHSIAVAQGKIAEILAKQGQPNEALYILKEKVLPVYRKLEEIRAIAVTQSQIADILAQQGQHDEALPMYAAALATHRQMENLEGIAATLWGMAQIDLYHKDIESATKKILEAYPLVMRMGRLEGIAVIGEHCGQILFMAGHREEGLNILRRSAKGYRQLGKEKIAAEIEALVQKLTTQPPTTPED